METKLWSNVNKNFLSAKESNKPNKPNKIIKSCWMGLLPYQQALNQQLLYAKKAEQNAQAYILGCEHPTTITLGKRASLKEELHFSLSELKQKKIPCFQTERGGFATLHSPGQLLIYPIVPLRKWNLSVRFFVDSLKQITYEYLSSLGLEFLRVKEDGIYSPSGKLVFMGFRIHQGVSHHGLAMNVKNNLNLFQAIRVCGKKAISLDSLERYSMEYSLKELFFQWYKHFLRFFMNDFKG